MTDYITIEPVAEYFKVSVGTIRRWVASGFIPTDTYIKYGKVYRFDLEAVEAAIRGKQMELPLEEYEEEDPRRFYRPKGDTK